jgi:hypothetical protein
MGNSKLAAKCHLRAAAPSEPPNQAHGILGRIPGDYIASGLATLPIATADAPPHHEVVIDARAAGTVRLFIEKKRVRHHRHSHYFWSAYRAEPVRPDDPA